MIHRPREHRGTSSNVCHALPNAVSSCLALCCLALAFVVLCSRVFSCVVSSCVVLCYACVVFCFVLCLCCVVLCYACVVLCCVVLSCLVLSCDESKTTYSERPPFLSPVVCADLDEDMISVFALTS